MRQIRRVRQPTVRPAGIGAAARLASLAGFVLLGVAVAVLAMVVLPIGGVVDGWLARR